MRESVDQARSVKWGWRILIGACALYVLNGVTWLFLGPTATVADMADNLGGGRGRLPDEATRKRMIQVVDALPQG